MTYSGWTNYATWNVGLWADNDYSLYHARCAWMKRKSEITGADVREWVQDNMGGTTPDLSEHEGHRIQDVNWSEIAEHWEDERRELLEYEA